jgi:hypothetical protein
MVKKKLLDATSARLRYGEKGSGLNSVVVSVVDCNPKGSEFDSRVMLGIFSLRQEGLRNLGKEANLSVNPESIVAPVIAFFEKARPP